MKKLILLLFLVSLVFYGNAYANIDDLEELTIKLFETGQKIDIVREKVGKQLSIAEKNKNAADIKFLIMCSSKISKADSGIDDAFRILVACTNSEEFRDEVVSERKYVLSRSMGLLKEALVFLNKNYLAISSKLNIPQNDISALIQNINSQLSSLNSLEQYIILNHH